VKNERPQSILIVETDPSRCAATKDVLQSAGFDITCASSFNEAKRMLAASPPDMLITGLQLGEYNGLHLVLRTRAEHPEMAAIVTSDVADCVLQAEAERHRAQFLVRPLDTGRLLSAVSRSLENQAAQSAAPNIAAG
jgi:DNA-binding NtrC family response regulator